MQRDSNCNHAWGKKFQFFCHSVKQRNISLSQNTEDYNRDHAYSIFHKVQDMRVMVLTMGRSRLHTLPAFYIDGEGQFRRNGNLIYEYYNQIACARKVEYIKSLISECMGSPYNETPEITVFHFARSKAPISVCSGDITIGINWVIFLISLLLFLCCLK
ncbi:hypothetical protein KR026_011873 [Drosophila bipectinata]|nr:hypothetical protein KR026_011873 [Drosophila bipectinata]